MPHSVTLRRDVILIALADVSRDARTLNLARALAMHGMKVCVASAAPEDYSIPGVQLLKWQDPGGSAFRRWRSFTAWCRTIDTDARVVGAMDLFALRGALSVAKKLNVHTLYDMREFYFALGPLRGRGWKQRIVAMHERRSLKSVNAVIVSGDLDAAVVRKRFALKDPPFVILNTPPYKERVESDVLRKKFGIDRDQTIVLYQGVVHEGRGLRPFIDALPHLPGVHLCIVGDGPAKESIAEYAANRELEQRVHWMGSVAYDDLHVVTCSADIGLCLIEPVSLSYEYALPNKLFEYMMARIPSLVSDLRAMHNQVMRTPVGMLVNQELRVVDIVEAMQRLRHKPTYDEMSKACDAIRELSYERQAIAAADMFREHMK